MHERREIHRAYYYPIEHQEFETHSNIAILLPGQDIQEIGMFGEIAKYPAGREVLERADSFLNRNFGYKISDIAREGADPDILGQTQYTQPAVFTLSIAIHNVNRHHRDKDGYRTLPRYMTGNSGGMLAAVMLSGATDFEEGLWLSAMRGKVMQEHGDKTPTSMVAAITNEEVIRELLGREEFEPLDLCRVNSDSTFVIGGPNEVLERAIDVLASQKVKTKTVKTDRSMHGRYVRPAKPKFSEVLRQVSFKTPIIPLVGIHTGLPIGDTQGIIEELEVGFDHTFDNTKVLRFFDEEGVHVISEVNKKGTFARIFERTLNAVATHKLKAVGVGVGAIAIAGVGLYEVFTRHNPQNHKR